LIGAGGALLLLIVLAIGVTLLGLRRTMLADAWVGTDDLAIVLAEQTSRSVQAVDIVLRDIQERIAALGVTTPEGFRHTLRTKEVHDLLVSRAERLPQVDNLALVGADGVRVNYSIGWPAPAVDMSDREYARHFTAHDDRGLFISEPVVNRATFVWSLYLVRRVNGPTGDFLGMVLASVPLRTFAEFYQSLNLLRGESFLLARRDGTAIVRHPDLGDKVGTKMPAGSAWYRLVAENGGHYESPGAFDTTARLIAVRPLRDYPLVVDVGLAKDTALAHWRREAGLIAAGTVTALGCLVLLSYLLERQFRRLRASEQRLETTLAAMDQGLVMVDARGSVAVCNRRAIELLDLPADLMSHRPQLATVTPLRRFAEHAGCGRNAELPYETELPNGRIIEIHHRNLLAGEDGWVATYEDITARRRAEQQVTFMARHDPLTLLPNRNAFCDTLQAVMAHANRPTAAAVLYLDLDHFKAVNDTLGHPVGDQLLCTVARRLSECVRQADTVARFGGDEFAVVQVGPDRAEDVAKLAQRIVDTLSSPYEIDGQQMIIGVSLGIALATIDGSDPDTLLKNADVALYRAKADGRGLYRFFEPEMDARLQERRRLELELRDALTNEQFELFFQPQVELSSGRICAFEALLRWHHPTRGYIAPNEFIWLTEETGLIGQIGQWALRHACREATGWPGDVRVAVNLSPAQFNHHDLVRDVTEALEASGLPPCQLDLEITESVLLIHSAENIAVLRALHDLGVNISMDDFGTGYSSLSYLRSFPFDKIKIDQSFIRDLPHDEDAAAIVRAITALGNALGMGIVAEGVERADQLARLCDEGCNVVQGYCFSVPRPASEIPAMLERLYSPESLAMG
jgi:diguanylate cyclase (GGDEF)-like protein